jgi:PKD repeat protein
MVMNRISKILLLILLAQVHFLNGQTISKAEYKEKLRGFWLGSSIANWTGLKTEGLRNDKPYFTDEDWNTNQGQEWLGAYIDFVLDQEIWGADDDTDIEYIYQHALETYDNYLLTGDQIRAQWLEHISAEEENFLWVSNQTAFDLMQDENMIPPVTSLPHVNENWEMIDAQLTTEIFGLLAPTNPDVALDVSYLPIRTTAYSHSLYAAQFYVIMHALASSVDQGLSSRDQILWLADSARTYIPESSYISKMYDWVRNEYMNSTDKDDWESVRDGFHDIYIEGGADDYTYSAFYDCGSNFGFSIVSLLFGEGDFKRTVQIGTLSGQDSDNPTATWGGLLGFIYGFKGLEEHFDKYDFSEQYDINRTRINFGEGLDTFSAMAERLLPLIDKVVVERMNGTATAETWTIDAQTASKYYVSAVNGTPDGNGSSDNPWDSLDDIDGYPFLPGDSVLFERGSEWIGSFEINDGNAIRISASHILIEDFYIHDCGLSEPRTVGGISSFNRDDHHITVQNIEFSGCRVGVRLYAHDVLITNNYLHSPGGGINEWWGPMSIVGAGYSGEISYNIIEGFLAPNNYGYDGGAIELDDEGIHIDWKIHHNVSRGNEGFLETYDDSECDDCTWGGIEIYYNYSDDYQWFMDGPIGNDPVIENNTILRVLPANTDFNWGISLHHTIPQGSVRNNIFVLANGVKAFEWENPGAAPSNNIYFSVDGSLDNPKGYPLGENEVIADPLFTDYEARDLRLLHGSPAIDKGENTDYSVDLDNNPVPSGNAPDLGAYESSFFAIVPRFEIMIDQLTIELDGGGSLAEDQQSITSYTWDFGDETGGSGSALSHTYGDAGTYLITLTVTSSSGESATSTKSVTVNKPPDPIQNMWRSFDAKIQPGTPQATISDGITSVDLQFFESIDDDGVNRGELLTPHNAGVHPEAFNHVENFWGEDYPYVGKSTVPQGDDTDESKEQFPGVLDLQMHPPNDEHLIVCAFEAPFSGNYIVSNLGIRRVYDEGSGTALKLFGPDKKLLATLSGTSRSWNYDVKTYTMRNVAKGDLIYFAVDNVDGFAFDAVEILWNIRFDGLKTGFNHPGKSQDMHIYPNPSTGLVRLTFARASVGNNSTLHIRYITGKKIDTYNLRSQNLTLDLTHFPTGIYLLQYGAVFKRIIIR